MSFLSCIPCFGEEGEKEPPFTVRRHGSMVKTALSSTSDSESRVQLRERENLKDVNQDSETTVVEIHDSFDHKPLPLPLPKRNRALMVVGKKTYRVLENYPYPTLQSDDEVIISNRAVGLNPIDWKSVDFNFCLPEFPWITGREMAGVVDAVGANVKEFKVGDRVWTSTYYRDRRAGCFQHYVTVPQHTVSRIPDNLDFSSAACLGVAGLTAAMTLWRWLEVPRPSLSSSSSSTPTPSPPHTHPATTMTPTPLARTTVTPTFAERQPQTRDAAEDSEFLLIWGGSAVTAQFAIQMAVLSGLQTIAVASEKTMSLVFSLGATHVVTRDGKTEDEIVAEIRQLGGDNITRAVDLVGPKTARYCLQAMSRTKTGLFAPLAMISSNDTFIPANIQVQTVEMKQFVLNPDSRLYAAELNRLVSNGLLVIPSMHVLKGGIESIQAGLERLKSGDMAGKKMVVSMAS